MKFSLILMAIMASFVLFSAPEQITANPVETPVIYEIKTSDTIKSLKQETKAVLKDEKLPLTISTIPKASVTDKLDNISKLKEEVQDHKPQYTEDDIFCLAAVVCCEAGGESEEAQLLVANVVLNRVAHNRYSDTIREVLTEPYQYGLMWKNGIKFPKWATEKTVKKCYAVAKRILEGERVCPESVIYQAEFIQGSAIFKEVDGMYFCYE